MILLREARTEDAQALEALANIPGFINLPSDAELLKQKIRRSEESFRGKADPMSGKFMFVAEDVETKRVLGTAMLAQQHGTPDSPHFYFEIGNEKKYSETINTGFIHGTLKLKYDTDGPSEIGGLVVDAESRNSDDRVGRQVSFVRFLFVAANRNLFRKKMIAELLPPLNKKGQSPLWEAIGRRFTNMDYWEADELCNKNKEFIFSLFPTGKIYTSFLSAEARNAIGKVGKQTEPVLHMLTKIGFKYTQQVDPFDGGPHLWANIDDLTPVKKTKLYQYKNFDSESAESSDEGLLCLKAGAQSKFRAIQARCEVFENSIQFANSASGTSGANGDQDKNREKQLMDLLELKPGDQVYFMPYY